MNYSDTPSRRPLFPPIEKMPTLIIDKMYLYYIIMAMLLIAISLMVCCVFLRCYIDNRYEDAKAKYEKITETTVLLEPGKKSGKRRRSHRNKAYWQRRHWRQFQGHRRNEIQEEIDDG